MPLADGIHKLVGVRELRILRCPSAGLRFSPAPLHLLSPCQPSLYTNGQCFHPVYLPWPPCRQVILAVVRKNSIASVVSLPRSALVVVRGCVRFGDAPLLLTCL